jgi:hypothetical protein
MKLQRSIYDQIGKSFDFDQYEKHQTFYSRLMQGPNFSWLVGGVIAFFVGSVLKVSEYYPYHHMYFKYNQQHVPDLLWLNGAGFALYSVLDAVEQTIIGADSHHN